MRSWGWWPPSRRLVIFMLLGLGRWGDGGFGWRVMGVLVGECSLVSSFKKRHALFFERTNTPLENALVLSFVFSPVLALFLKEHFSRVL